MNFDQVAISTILIGSLLLFAIGRVRHDMVAIITLIAAVVLGLIPAQEAFLGFGHPAVITVIAVLIISQALNNAGVVGMVSNQLRKIPMTPILLLLILTSLVTFFSAFMNNVGALALMLPVAMVAANEHKIPPAMLLMPLAFGSILGGLATLIGTPPNIIISSYRAVISCTEFSMFDFSPVGVPLAILGVLFISLIGWRFIPKKSLSQNSTNQLFQINTYLTELRVPEGSSLIGIMTSDIELFSNGTIELVGVATQGSYARPIKAIHAMQANEVLLVRCDPQDIRQLLDKHNFELLTTATQIFNQPDPKNAVLQEVVVSQESSLVGRDVRFLRREMGEGVALVGIARQGETVVKRLRRQKFEPGDVLLLMGHEDSIHQHLSALHVLPLVERPLELERRRHPILAITLFGLSIAAGVMGWVDLTVAFLLAIISFIVSGAIRAREIYEQIDWPVVVLLGAMLPIGKALETTGTTQILVNFVFSSHILSDPTIALLIILVLSMLLSAVVNNAATALVMAPVAISIAQNLTANPDTFLMAVAIGSSCAFLTPIGHQSNTLVMGPGGYKFGDYWRVGLPLEILIIAVSIPLLLWAWPLDQVAPLCTQTSG